MTKSICNTNWTSSPYIYTLTLRCDYDDYDSKEEEEEEEEEKDDDNDD
jgi:hypothetical protein